MAGVPTIIRKQIENEAGMTYLNLDDKKDPSLRKEMEFFKAIHEGCEPC
jgi:hypothetical protein